MSTDLSSSAIIEYVWIGGNNELRSKIKVIKTPPNVLTINNIPKWNYDGSSTQQAEGKDSEVILNPCSIFKTATKEYAIQHYYVLCDTYTPDGIPLPSNNRNVSNNIFNKFHEEEPWFGLEQEYFIMQKIMDREGNTKVVPIGMSTATKQGQYYCSVGAENAFGRRIAEEHLAECISIGIKISGINAEVAPGQWEFQVGPCLGIEGGDHLWMARYLLCKVAERHNLAITFEPKPIKGNWNGSGCHTNFSTLKMREGDQYNNGLYYINRAIDKLSLKHKEHMDVYGSGNKERMTGKLETASYDTFTSGIADRGCSIRIGNENYNNKKGYFEDRRPSSNCDPYLVTSKLVETICL